MRFHSRLSARTLAASSAGLLGLLTLQTPAEPGGGGGTVATTVQDFVQLGTQPNALTDEVFPAAACGACHFSYDPQVEPGFPWLSSMMGQSMRDPMFHAAMSVALQDAPGSGEFCIRCHSPGGWLEGRSDPPDGSALFGKDFDGVSCIVCHRMVDPIADPANPAPDAGILADLGADVPIQPHNGQYVVDPLDRRRGPFELDPEFGWHAWEQSDFHTESAMCANCHEVSNPVYSRVGGETPSASDTYVPNAMDTPHPTQDKYDFFPIERTWSEWSKSDFADGPVEMGGLFGGNKTAVSSCQDCHMPDASGVACAPGFGGAYRDDLPTHHFSGANSWVLNAVLDLDQSLLLYGPSETSQLDQQLVDEAIARNVDMLGRAAELALSEVRGGLRVRVVNNTGHKLPTGYPEGRRMWVNVQFLDAAGAIVGEHGHYDFATADLTTDDTKVYEMKIGLDSTMAAATGLPEGESFHFALNNTVVKDNRIPPRGFTNAEFETIQASPVGYEYADGQHWDWTEYDIPCGAAAARVTLYYQTTSKEYVEFLRDENTSDSNGQIAYDLWLANGMSEPVVMEQATLYFEPRIQGDVDTISTSTGGVQTLCLSGGAVHAGDTYWILGSAGGTHPTFPFAGFEVPLAFDAYTFFTAANPNSPPLAASLGTLDGMGNATATFTVPPGTVAGPAVLAATFSHAYLIFDGATSALEAVSDASRLKLVP